MKTNFAWGLVNLGKGGLSCPTLIVNTLTKENCLFKDFTIFLSPKSNTNKQESLMADPSKDGNDIK